MSGLERAARRRSRGDRDAREATPGEQRSTDAGARQDVSEAGGEGDVFDPTEALLLVSICTYGAGITKGKELAGAYFVTANSSWKSKEAFAKTSVRLDIFCQVIGAIQVPRHRSRCDEAPWSSLAATGAFSFCPLVSLPSPP